MYTGVFTRTGVRMNGVPSRYWHPGASVLAISASFDTREGYYTRTHFTRFIMQLSGMREINYAVTAPPAALLHYLRRYKGAQGL